MRRLLLAAIVPVLCTASLPGADGRPAPAAQDKGPTFSARAELVVLHVSVTDRHGEYVAGLPRDAFTVFEDGRPQPISFFTGQDSPVTVGLIVDSSGSMREIRKRVVAAVAAFAGASHPDDDLFALTFNEAVHEALPPDTPFTSDPETLRASLARAITAWGKTALYDALARGLEHVTHGRHPRLALVLVADGADNASGRTFDEVLREAQASNAAIYTVGIIDPLEPGASRRRLRELADATGGAAFFPRSVDDVEDVLAQIAREIRHTYTIGFVPSDLTAAERFRTLRVEVDGSENRSLTVRTRSGYLSGVSATRAQ